MKRRFSMAVLSAEIAALCQQNRNYSPMPAARRNMQRCFPICIVSINYGASLHEQFDHLFAATCSRPV